MASLRDLFVTFGIKYDDKGAKKADHDLDKLKGKAKGTGNNLAGAAVQANSKFTMLGKTIAGIGAGLGFAALAHGVRSTLAAASSAEEVNNQLSVLFGKEGTDQVKNFSDTTAKEMKRSSYEVQRFAATIGALAVPQLQSMGEEGIKQAQMISTDLAGLAFDLSSFVEGTTEEDALVALRSGISGETEPLKQFGINLTEEGIANALGISKKQVRSAGVATKTLQRYQAIMKLSAVAQGDAARSADTYKGAMNAMNAAILDFKTDIGKGFLNVATDMLQWFRSAILAARDLGKWIKSVAKTTNIFETVAVAGLITALGALILAFNTTAVSAAVAGVIALLPWLLIAAAVGALILIFEDLWTGMMGGQSVIGEFLDSILGVDNTLVILRQTFESIGAAIYDLFHGGGEALDDFIDAWLQGFNDIIKWWKTSGFKEILDSLESIPFLGRLVGGLRGVAGELNDIGEAAGKALAGPSVGEEVSRTDSDSVAARAAALRKRLGITGDVVGGARSFAELRANAALTPAMSTPMSSSNQTNVTVNVSGGSSPRDTGREVERGIRNALAEDRRRTSRGIR